MLRTTITGWGKCVPPAVLSNSDLEKMTDTTDEWITGRTGIKERRITHVENSDMAVVAGQHALAAAGLDATDMDSLIVATCTPDRILPSSASFVQAKIGAVNAAALDINAACSGFVYGLTIANGLIASGGATRVLLIGSEKLSVFFDIEDRSTAVLFGDGAGAVVLEATEGREGIVSTTMGSDGTLAGALTVSGFGSESNVPPEIDRKIYMDGREIFRSAVVRMGEAAAKAVADAGWELEDVDLLIPHQANRRILDATAKKLGLPLDKVIVTIDRHANTSAASVPLALSEAVGDGRVKPGDTLLMEAMGGGFSWGACVARW